VIHGTPLRDRPVNERNSEIVNAMTQPDHLKQSKQLNNKLQSQSHVNMNENAL